MGKSYTRQLAEFCSEMEFGAIPSSVVQKTKWAILDNLGVILGASTTALGKQIANFVMDLHDREEATALGFGFKSSTRNAAFLNGSLSEILELQDGYTKGGIHPCCGVISAALASAEHLHKRGRDLLLSVVTGYEVANRVSEVMHPSHLGRGFQPTGTAGTIGAAAAVGKLMEFEADQMFNAMGIAGFILPVSTGDNLWGGHTIKPIHGGAAAKAGIESAMLSRNGFSACSLEGDPKLKKGFCAIVSDKPDFAKLTESLGERYTTTEIYFKPYACCRIHHAPVEIVLDLAKSHHLESNDIENIIVKTYKYAALVPGQIRTDPGSNPLLCQFSTSYCVAVALIDKNMGLEQFSPERVKDPLIHQLASRVSIVADAELEGLRPANRPAIVEIYLKSGKRLLGRVDYPKGDPRKPMSDKELLEKFMGLASYILTEEKAEKLRLALFDLERISDVSSLAGLCC